MLRIAALAPLPASPPPEEIPVEEAFPPPSPTPGGSWSWGTLPEFPALTALPRPAHSPPRIAWSQDWEAPTESLAPSTQECLRAVRPVRWARCAGGATLAALAFVAGLSFFLVAAGDTSPAAPLSVEAAANEPSSPALAAEAPAGPAEESRSAFVVPAADLPGERAAPKPRPNRARPNPRPTNNDDPLSTRE